MTACRKPGLPLSILLGLSVSLGSGGCAARPTTPAITAPAPSPPVIAPASGPAAPTRRARRPGPPPLVGHLSRGALEQYETWKTLRAEDYTPDASDVQTIAERFAGVETLAVVATWCPDSKRDVPRFFKILDLAHVDLTQVTLVGVDRTKQDAGGLTSQHAITLVPTLVFFRGGREIGRVTERPKTTLEHDIALIVSK